MLSPTERARITADLVTLKKAYEAATDNGTRRVIRDWILDAEKTLAEEAKRAPKGKALLPRGVTEAGLLNTPKVRPKYIR
jgi:hypothetical protein